MSSAAAFPFDPVADRAFPRLPADGSAISRPGDFGAPCDVDAVPRTARGAVIIPAHNEAAVIRRTLGALAPLIAGTGVEVIVVCNACSDDTAEIASAIDGVHVEEIGEASKTGALNVGDRVATAWPRLYLDADIEIAPRSVLAVFDALGEPGVLAARAFHVYDTSDATIPVRAYYRARSRTPAPSTRLWGAGGYAVNERGHHRFSEFPSVTADDSWFDAQFDEAEKRVVATSPMRVRTPRDAASLIAVLTRQRRGYIELGVSSHAGSRGRALVGSVRRTRDAVDLFWYAALTVIARRRSEKILRRSGTHSWERDASTRRRSEQVGP